MTRTSRRVGDCGICGRTKLGLVVNFNHRPDTTSNWRLARHRKPDGSWCFPTIPERVYEAEPGRAVMP